MDTAQKVDHGAKEAERHGLKRSPHWPAVEHAFLAANPVCAACGPLWVPGRAVQVHHRFPFHEVVALGRPDLELDPRNLITLCETEHDRPAPNHHLLLGHLDDFKTSNPAVAHHAQIFFGKTAAEIQADPTWQAARAARMKPLDQWADAEKQAFVEAMNATYPKP